MLVNPNLVLEVMLENKVLADDPQFDDPIYLVPKVEWLRNVFAPKLKKFFEQIRLTKYIKNKRDCDKFSKAALFFAQLCHDRTPTVEAGPLFGNYRYRTLHLDENGERTGHCICVTIDVDKRKPIFFEPQFVLKNMDPIVELALEERTECLGYSF